MWVQCFDSVEICSCLHQSEPDRLEVLRQTPHSVAGLLNGLISMNEKKGDLFTIDVTPSGSVDVEHSKVSLKNEGEERHEDVVAVDPGSNHFLEVNVW